MQIPATGCFCIGAAIGCFLFYREGLYICTILFLPFSAMAIVNVGDGDSAHGVQAWMFFGALWMLREFWRLSPSAHPRTWQLLRRPRSQIVVFVLVAVFSLVVPLTAAGSIWIESAELMSNGATPLSLTSEQITQVLYLIFGALFALFIAIKNSRVGQFEKTVRVFAASVTFTAIWGLMQWVCFQLAIQYPSFLFNTSATESAKGYLQDIRYLGLTRISSVATEPSTFAQCTIVALSFATVALLFHRPFFRGRLHKSAIALMIAALVLSTASTAYIGLFTLAAILAATLVHFGSLRKSYAVAAFSSAVALFVGVLTVPVLRQLAESQLIGKFETFSGIERVNSVLLAANYFLVSPILGVGWGTVTSHDIVFELLSNVGIAGFLAFLIFVVSMLRRLWRMAWRCKRISNLPCENYWSLQMLIAVILVLFLATVDGFPLVYGDFWLVLGLGLAAPILGGRSGGSVISGQVSHARS